MPSTVIRNIAYDAKTREMTVTFTTSRRYVYRDVSQDVVTAFRAARSKGEFFNLEIRDEYDYVEIDSAS